MKKHAVRALSVATIGIQISVLGLGASSPVWAQQQAPGQAQTGPGPAMQSTNAFNASQIASLGGLFSSCQGATLAGATGALASCMFAPPGDLKEVSKNLSCEAFSPSGAFSLELFEKRLKQFEDADKGIACQKGKLDAVRGQLQCLSSQASALAAQIGSLAGEYQKNLSRMQTDVNKLNSQINDRKEQDQEVLARLNGDSKSGRAGLNKVKEEVEQELGKMPAALEAVQKNNQELANMKATVTEKLTERTTVLAKECFDSRADASFLCQKNAAPVKLKDYVLCRFEQNQFKRDNGVIEDNRLNQTVASGRRAALEQLLGEMFQDAPKEKSVMSGPQSVEVLSFDDIERRFGKRLEGFNGKGLNISSFVLSNAKACFQRAQKTVARERKLKTSEIGRMQEQVVLKERSNEAAVRTKLQEYNQSYMKAMKAMTGNNYPLVLTACERGAPDVQERCLGQIEREFRGIVNGNTPNSEIAMTIPSSQPESTINFTCRGINGCQAALQNISTKLNQEVVKARAFKRDYVVKANQSIDSFTARMATVLGVQNEALDQQIRNINSMMAGLGVKGTVDLKPVEAEELEKDGELGEENDNGMGGLYKLPKSLMKLVGGKMSPPMLDVTENSFKEALGGIAEAGKELDEKKSQIQEASDKLVTLKGECLKKEEDLIKKKLDEVLGKVRECSRNIEFCEGDGSDALVELRDDVGDLGFIGSEPDISGTLSKGISQCQQSLADFEKTVEGENRDKKLAERRLGERNSTDCSAVVTSVKRQADDLNAFRERSRKTKSTASGASL